MVLDTKYCMCDRLDEDGGHLLLNCKEVKSVWRELNMEVVSCNLAEAGSPREMMEEIFALGKREQLTAIMLLWLWWGERNSLREEGRCGTASEVSFITAFQADTFLKIETITGVPKNIQRQRWVRPPEGFLKVNSDGSV